MRLSAREASSRESDMDLSPASYVLVAIGALLALAPHLIQRVLLRVYRDSPFVGFYRGKAAMFSFMTVGIGLVGIVLLPPLLGACLLDCFHP